MIYYIYKLTNNMFQSINYLLIFYFNRAYNSITNYFVSNPNPNPNITLIKPINLINLINPPNVFNPTNPNKINNKLNFRVIKSISYNIFPNSFSNNPVLLDIYSTDKDILDSLEIFNFDYNVKYLSSDRLYGWYIDIEEKEKFISSSYNL